MKCPACWGEHELTFRLTAHGDIARCLKTGEAVRKNIDGELRAVTLRPDPKAIWDALNTR